MDKIRPNDPRVESKFATVRGKTYHYLLANPSGPAVDTIFLYHGFPDISLAWRYQIPFLLSLDLRVVVPDTVGYGRTDAPQDLAAYSMKSTSDDLAELAAQVCGAGVPFILGGHDWGAYFVQRMVLWHPALVKAVFTACVPFDAPRETYVSLDDAIAAGRLQNFRYQLQLKGPDVEREIQGEAKIRQFLRSAYGGVDPEGRMGFDIAVGVLFDRLPHLGGTPLLSDEEMEYYVREFARSGVRGPLNWYRTREINHADELELVRSGATRVTMPALFIQALQDVALPPELAKGQEAHFDKLTSVEVDASHWILWEKPQEVNDHLKAWLEKCGLIGPRASL